MVSLASEDSGQSLIEYAFVAAVIAIGAVASMQVVGCQLSSAFNTIGNTISNAF